MSRAAPIMLSVCLLNAAGCYSTVRPKGPHVGMVLEDGGLAFVRDGESFSHGMFGSGLVDAVASNEDAEQFARDYRAFNIAGFVLNVTAIVPAATGAAVLAVSVLDSPDRTPSGGALGGTFALLGGALSMSITGMVMTVIAQPKMFDAMNQYNLGVDEALSQPRPGGVPSVAPVVTPPAPPPTSTPHP